ncbi:MAG: hypothetical protein KAH14_01665 [Clostridiales bacterium]|nr:hypothetical protein [Clostridiales bacterium]
MNKVVYVSPDRFASVKWKRLVFQDNTLYFYKQDGIRLIYSSRTHRLTFEGCLYNLSVNRNRVGNLDLLYEGMAGIHIEQEVVTNDEGIITTRYHARAYTQDLDQLINEANEYVNNLLGIHINLRTFNVTYIEFCFNLQTPYVREYCRMFNKVFRERNMAGYTNDVQRRGFSEDSGFYIKSNTQYKKKTNGRSGINFYNKLNQLGNLIRGRSWDFDPDTFGDITEAFNVLRLEVQVGYSSLYQLNQQQGIGRTFESYLDPGIARDVVASLYDRIIGLQNSYFYSYQEACHVIDNSEYTIAKKRRIREFLLNYVRHQHAPSRNTWYKYVRLLRDIGIHWCLIPSSYNIPQLESPIALLDRHITSLEENRENMTRRFLITELTAELYNSITVEEEEVVEIPDEILDDL